MVPVICGRKTRFTMKCSILHENKLNHSTKGKKEKPDEVWFWVSWWAIQDLNLWPSACKAAALPLRQSPVCFYRFTKDEDNDSDCKQRSSEKPQIKAVFSVNALHEQNALSSHGLHRSTFGEEGLNYRVRNGIGWSPSLWFRSCKAFACMTDPLATLKVA